MFLSILVIGVVIVFCRFYLFLSIFKEPCIVVVIVITVIIRMHIIIFAQVVIVAINSISIAASFCS